MSSKKGQKVKLQIQNKYNRTFSDTFKREKIQQVIEKQLSISQLCSLYSISRTTAYKWLYKYSPHYEKGTKQVIQMESEVLKTKVLLSKVAELERIIGQKQMELDFTKKLIELASEEVGYDIKKKHEPSLLSGFDKGDTNTATL